MSLTGGYDYCVQLTIEVVREIFHQAFKQEDRFPHNFGPVDRTFTVPGATPLAAQVRVRVYDEVGRPADLWFESVDVVRFSFPVDIQVDIADAPSPELSKIVLSTVIEAPGRLVQFPPSEEDGPNALGVDFSTVAAGEVVVGPLSGLPTIDSAALVGAIHQAYESGSVPHQVTEGGFVLTLYDGSRDPTLSPPNTTGAEITATLGADDWVQIVLPVHVGGTSTGYTLDTRGTVTLYRRLLRSDEAIVLALGTPPDPGDAAHQTLVLLDEIPAVDAEVFEAAFHQAYLDGVFPHQHSTGLGTITFYDGTADPSLTPAHPLSAEITTELLVEGTVTYLRVRIPCHVSAALSSFGVLRFDRVVNVTPTTVSVDFGAAPGAAGHETVFQMEVSYLDGVLAAFTGTVEIALDSVGPQSGPNPSGTLTTAIAQAADAFAAAFGDVAQAAPSEARARELIAEEVANYLRQQHFPLYTPDPGENDAVLTSPVGKLLVAEEVLAIQLTPRVGEPDEVPESFVGANRMALAVGLARVNELIQQQIAETFPDLHTEQGDRIEEVTDRKVWLRSLSVSPADGHFDVSGSASVEIDCWWDPDVEFSGPVYLVATTGVDEDGNCTLQVDPEPGDFDLDQSCCDILIQIFIPVVGWIMAAVITSALDAVGTEVFDSTAGTAAQVVEALPPVVIGIAAVESCLVDVRVQANGMVFPGKIEVERVDRSFEELAEERRQPSGG
ncbi:hypothetical protein L6R50_13975 [Myxococcota bacterium]|nr:hypothetical protein [Myxococcota bacterium]